MFERVNSLLDDLDAFSADPARVKLPFSFSSNELGAALLQLAAGRTPLVLESSAPGSAQFESAERFLANIVFSPKNSYFTLLCVDRDAPDDVLRENYRRLIALVHPDARPIGFPTDAAARVNLGYAVLSNLAARTSYAESLERLPLTSADAVTANPQQNQANRTSDRARTRAPVPAGGVFRWIRRPRFGVGLLALAVLLILPVFIVMTDMAKDNQGDQLVSGRGPVGSGQSVLAKEVAAGSPKSGATMSYEPARSSRADAGAISARANSAAFANSSPVREMVPATAPVETVAGASRSSPDQSAIALSNGEPAPPLRIRPSDATTPMKLLLAPVPNRLFASTEAPAVRVESPSAAVTAARPAVAATSDPVSPPVPSANAANAANAATAATSGVGTGAQPPAGSVQIASASAPRVTQARTRDAEDMLLRFGSAYEQGSIDGVRTLFAAAMPGRVQMITDYQRVFSSTQQRSIRFLQLKHTIVGERVTTVGQAVVSTLSADNKKASQRVFLEIEVARDGNEVRIERMSNYALD